MLNAFAVSSFCRVILLILYISHIYLLSRGIAISVQMYYTTNIGN